MSSIYCSQCGSKHQAGAKFCSSCGNALSALSRQVNQVNQIADVEVQTEESFRRPKGLAYEIDRGGNNVYKAEDIFNSNPVDEGSKIKRPIGQQTKMSEQELLSESLKECAPVKNIKEINET